MLDAGNVDAAVRHCKAAIDYDLHHIDVYSLQIDILSAKDRPQEAINVTTTRLAETPDCRLAHLQLIRLNGQMGRAGLAKTAMDQVRLHFADDPMMIHDCQLMHDTTTGRDAYVLNRVQHLRKTGYWGVLDLDSLEQSARANMGHIATLGRLQQADLERGDIDPETLHVQSVVRYLQGRLLSARKLAAQARDTDPTNGPLYAETRFAATLGLVPLMWPAQLFIVLAGSLTSRFPWFIRIFTNYALALLAIGFLMLMLGGIASLPGVPPGVSGAITGVIGIANVAWALYVIWAFGSFGRWRAGRAKRYTISKDY